MSSSKKKKHSDFKKIVDEYEKKILEKSGLHCCSLMFSESFEFLDYFGDEQDCIIHYNFIEKKFIGYIFIINPFSEIDVSRPVIRYLFEGETYEKLEEDFFRVVGEYYQEMRLLEAEYKKKSCCNECENNSKFSDKLSMDGEIDGDLDEDLDDIYFKNKSSSGE